MKFILATKEYMTTYFAPDGRAIPVTVVHAGPITVTQVKTQELDGYDAIQYGSGTQKESRMTKAEIGHLKELQKTNILREVRLDMPADVKRGDTADVSLFTPGDVVSVSGISKVKDFKVSSSDITLLVDVEVMVKSILNVKVDQSVEVCARAYRKACECQAVWELI